MWFPVLSQPVSPIPVVPVCCSSSLPGCLSWMPPLFSIAPCSDLSLVSWALLSLRNVSVPILPPPPLFLQVFLD
jgi:hypothetical protein